MARPGSADLRVGGSAVWGEPAEAVTCSVLPPLTRSNRGAGTDSAPR